MIIYLKADTKESMLSALSDVLEAVDNELVLSTHKYWCNLIGKKRELSGKMLADNEGNEYPESVEIEGYFAELHVKELEPYLALKVIADDLTVFKEYDMAIAKAERENGQHDAITVGGLTYDVGTDSYNNIVGTIASWDTLVQDPVLTQEGLVDGSTMLWTLENNELTKVTKEMLQAVLDAIHIRKGLLHINYTKTKLK